MYTDQEKKEAWNELHRQAEEPFFFEEMRIIEKERGKFLEGLSKKVDKLYGKSSRKRKGSY